jgi:hypothetical protein
MRPGGAIALLVLADHTRHRDAQDDPAFEEGVEQENWR